MCEVQHLQKCKRDDPQHLQKCKCEDKNIWKNVNVIASSEYMSIHTNNLKGFHYKEVSPVVRELPVVIRFVYSNLQEVELFSCRIFVYML